MVSLDLYPFMTFGTLIVLAVLMLYCYLKVRRFLINLVIYLFSLIIGITAMSESEIPFTPYLQTFFLVFQTVIFLIMVIEVSQHENH